MARRQRRTALLPGGLPKWGWAVLAAGSWIGMVFFLPHVLAELPVVGTHLRVLPHYLGWIAATVVAAALPVAGRRLAEVVERRSLCLEFRGQAGGRGGGRSAPDAFGCSTASNRILEELNRKGFSRPGQSRRDPDGTAQNVLVWVRRGPRRPGHGPRPWITGIELLAPAPPVRGSAPVSRRWSSSSSSGRAARRKLPRSSNPAGSLRRARPLAAGTRPRRSSRITPSRPFSSRSTPGRRLAPDASSHTGADVAAGVRPPPPGRAISRRRPPA